MPPFGYDSIATEPLTDVNGVRSDVNDCCVTVAEGRRCVRISIQHRTERRLRAGQDGLIGPPLVGRLAVNRPPHLFRARSPHRPLGPVEFEHAARTRLRNSRATAHLALPYRRPSARRSRGGPARAAPVDMRHQTHIVSVISADVIEVVSEGLAAREMLAEVREAAAERVPAGVDDLRIRQDELDERHVQPVVRQLVDEERPIGPPLYARPLRYSWPSARRSPPTLRGCPSDKRPACAPAPGMSGSSDVPSTRLCEARICSIKSGARAWHADDEDRIRRCAAARSFRECVSREADNAAIDAFGDLPSR